MVKIDLITGFLGSGKTTFLRKYASYLLGQGLKIGILENDFGAVNVDMMLLSDLEGDNCELEMISGGCDADCHKRRFKTKLIALGMSGLDHVLVEPSGIYETDEFFDTLCEEPLDRWYEIGNVIAVVDANLDKALSKEAEYLLASQVASAGRIVLSKIQQASEKEITDTVAYLNDIMERYGCKCRLQKEIICKDWDALSETDFDSISSCGYVPENHVSLWLDKEKVFSSLYFMNVRMAEEKMRLTLEKIFRDPACGKIFRIKGFMQTEDKKWIEINATCNHTVIKPIQKGQEVLIVIGEELEEKEIRAYLSDIPEFQCNNGIE